LLNPLRNHKITSSWPAQAIIRKVYPVGKICTIRRGQLKGLRFRVSQGMGFTYAWGIGVEQWQFDGLVRSGMCVYDVGANCGQSTLSLARVVGPSGRVIAFEPVESVFADLSFNLNLNPALQVLPICAAAHEVSGRCDFIFRSDASTQGRLADCEPTNAIHDAETIAVRTVPLDNYRIEGWPIPQFLKIDVEGGAGSVLRGARNLISQCRPSIYIELHGPTEQKAVRDLLKTFRYKAQTLTGMEVADPAIGWSNPLLCIPA
jgi:FkbM family methyltransferase